MKKSASNTFWDNRIVRIVMYTFCILMFIIAMLQIILDNKIPEGGGWLFIIIPIGYIGSDVLLRKKTLKEKENADRIEEIGQSNTPSNSPNE